MITLKTIETIVASREPRGISLEQAGKRAAVSVVVRDGREGAEVLLMQRSIREGDRWSGQVSLPGGREEQDDSTLVDTAIRETREEVAIDLGSDARMVGGLDAIQARSRSGFAGLSVWPFVFFEESELTPTTSPEAEAVFWLPLGPVIGGALDSVYPYDVGGTRYDLPCWIYDGRTVWGMTHRMLSDFIALVRKAT